MPPMAYAGGIIVRSNPSLTARFEKAPIAISGLFCFSLLLLKPTLRGCLRSASSRNSRRGSGPCWPEPRRAADNCRVSHQSCPRSAASRRWGCPCGQSCPRPAGVSVGRLALAVGVFEARRYVAHLRQLLASHDRVCRHACPPSLLVSDRHGGGSARRCLRRATQCLSVLTRLCFAKS